MLLFKKVKSQGLLLVFLVFIGVLGGIALTFITISPSNPPKALALQAQTSDALTPAIKAAQAQVEAVQTAFRYVAETVQPSVVEINVVENVSTGKPGKPQDALPFRFFFGTPDQEQTPPSDRGERGLGSGIIVRQQGKTVYVLSNNHVIGNASKITVITFDEQEYQAEIVGKDDRKDIALIKFESTKAQKVATLGNSENVKVGDWAIAIGSPFGLVSSVTAGIISAVNRTGGPGGNINDFIQTDASINRGNSGGALANIRGEVIGMNTWIASPTGGSIGLGFAIPINNIKSAIDNFITTGKIEYGWVGISLGSLDKASAEELGVDTKKSAIAQSVFLNSPASKGGVLPGDIIVSVNNVEIKDASQLIRVIGDLPLNKTATLAVIRNGQTVNIKVTVTIRKSAAEIDDANLYFGLSVISLKSEDLETENIPANIKSGVFVTNVSNKSPASILGIQFKDIITEINEKPVKNLRDFYRLLNDPANKKISFTILRSGATITTPSYTKK